MAYLVRLFAGLPTYDGTRWNGGAVAELVKHYATATLETSSSLLANAFNECLITALNGRDQQGFTHFLLLHADVQPTTPKWPLVLHQEMERVGAKVLSVALPIKNDKGLTSIARETGDFWRPRRLTLKEIHEAPLTWTAPDLLINTGCLLIDLRDPFVEHVCFTIHDAIQRLDDGTWVCAVEPEDWGFSRQCRALDVPVYVTRAVSALHFGRWMWDSSKVYGLDTDTFTADTERDAIIITG